MKLTKSHYVALALGILFGVLEYLNQQTFAFKAPWHQVVEYGIFMLGAFAVTPFVGAQLGVAIANLLHLSHATIVAIATASYVLAGAVATFSIAGPAKGIILGVTAFVLSIFGPPPGPVPAPPVAAAVPVAPPTPAPAAPAAAPPAA